MNGIFLVALGAAWPAVRLAPHLKTAAYWAALYGTYANWAVTASAAAVGTAAMSPITAAGHSAQPWQESVITAGFVSVGLAIITCSVLVLWGLRKRVASSHPSELTDSR
jgi:hydroxylaminobenzene mutase